MQYQLTIRSQAQTDIAETARWYETQQTGLGNRFLDEIESTLDRLCTMPEAFAKVYQASRRVLVHKFPIAVHYIIDNDNIIFFAVIHGSRDPYAWQKRLQDNKPKTQ